MSTTRAHTASCHLLKSGQFDTRQRKSTSLVSVKTSNPNSDLDLKVNDLASVLRMYMLLQSEG